ncbi:MAG: metallophosphoesterase family protein [Bacteroidota bacterium]|nr:metallophosphoesterase family protein [Bacteroidota bacterium]
MKIGLLSDTHAWWDERFNKHFSECDEIWHAGDIGSELVADTMEAFKPVRAVYGNCDGYPIRLRYPRFLFFECEGMKVLMTHIGGYPGRYAPEILKELNQYRPDLFICGHSHILKVKYDRTRHLMHINPGAAGLQGFQLVRTLVRFDINAGKIENLDVIELNNHGA